MVTKVSTKGQVVLPSAIRRRLGLQPGDALDVKAEGERIILTPQKKRTRRKAKIIIDPVSGLPAVTLGPGAPVLTSKEVEEMLSDFP
jgi:AbrB family looped-hinge helix DNA binding protein